MARHGLPRLVEGRIAERWAIRDDLTMLRKLGACTHDRVAQTGVSNSPVTVPLVAPRATRIDGRELGLSEWLLGLLPPMALPWR